MSIQDLNNSLKQQYYGLRMLMAWGVDSAYERGGDARRKF